MHAAERARARSAAKTAATFSLRVRTSTNDRFVLGRGQRRRNGNPAQKRRRQREHEIVGRHLRNPAVLLHARAHASASVRNRHELGATLDPIAQGHGQRRHQAVVAALDPVGAASGGIARQPEFVNQLEEGEFLQIGEQKLREPGGRSPQFGIGSDIAQPPGCRLPRQVGRDGRVRPAFDQAIPVGEFGDTT